MSGSSIRRRTCSISVHLRALTRAKRWLSVCCPLRYYRYQPGVSDHHGYAQVTRFLPHKVQKHFRRCTALPAVPGDDGPDADVAAQVTSRSIRRRTKDLWNR